VQASLSWLGNAVAFVSLAQAVDESALRSVVMVLKNIIVSTPDKNVMGFAAWALSVRVHTSSSSSSSSSPSFVHVWHSSFSYRINDV
jgi:hypothetical protein